jgi:hypothetical protein
MNLSLQEVDNIIKALKNQPNNDALIQRFKDYKLRLSGVV